MNPKLATLNSPIVDSSMPSADEIVSARSFLRGSTFSKGGAMIQPKRFAAAKKETGASYPDLLAMIARSYQGGQGAAEQRQIDISNAAKEPQ